MNFTGIISLLVGISLYTTIWTYRSDTMLIFQLMSVGFMFLAGILSWLQFGAVKSITVLEFFFICVIGLSFVTSLGSGNDYAFQYTIILCIFLPSISLVSRVLDVDQIINIYVRTVLFILLTVLLVQGRDFLLALSVVTTAQGLFRFSPLGMHPNLVGVVYAGSAILLTFKGFYVENRFYKIVLFVGASVCCFFVLAASARSSLLALMLVFIFWASKYMRNLNKIRIFYVIVILLSLAGVLVLEFDKLYLFLSDILQFESETRGIDSGGTGRVALWHEGIQRILDNPIRLFFGYGFRSAEINTIGLSLENSYLTLIYEIGIIGTLVFVVLLIYFILKSLKLSDLHKEQGIGLYYMVAMTIGYFMLESMFNRYLLSIGSFFGVLFLLLIFKISIIKEYKLKFKF